MSSSKKLTCMGTLRQVFSLEFIDWRYCQSCWCFRPSFVNCCPSNFLSGSTLPPLPCVNKYTVYTYTVGKGGPPLTPRGGVWGSGPQTDKHRPQSPLTGQFFQMTTFCIAFNESYLSKVFFALVVQQFLSIYVHTETKIMIYMYLLCNVLVKNSLRMIKSFLFIIYCPYIRTSLFTTIITKQIIIFLQL